MHINQNLNHQICHKLMILLHLMALFHTDGYTWKDFLLQSSVLPGSHIEFFFFCETHFCGREIEYSAQSTCGISRM